jgi:RTX calcium-binding nonapeptide repeat (4 copies)
VATGGSTHQPRVEELQEFFGLAGNGQLYRAEGYPWALLRVESGSRTSSRTLVSPFVPPTILKAVGFVESSWHMANYSVPRGTSGDILVSFDCGYGVMQITSALAWSMDNGTATDAEWQVATNYGKNLAAGAQVMVDKWNAAPQFRPIVGNGNPSILEDWYYALWSYNGFVSANDPNRFPLTRGEYRCDGVNYTGFPYQERVIGCVRNPAQGLWNAIPMSYYRTLPAFTGCSGSCNTSSMDVSTPQPSHTESGGTTPPPPPPPPQGPFCDGRQSTINDHSGTINGTGGSDVIVGSSSTDVISGLGGNDLICAGEGSDLVEGGPGADVVHGGRGNDNVRGQAGNDTLNGDRGEDNLDGGFNSDRLNGGEQADDLTGGPGTDTCNGGAGTEDSAATCETVSGIP